MLRQHSVRFGAGLRQLAVGNCVAQRDGFVRWAPPRVPSRAPARTGRSVRGCRWTPVKDFSGGALMATLSLCTGMRSTAEAVRRFIILPPGIRTSTLQIEGCALITHGFGALIDALPAMPRQAPG